MTFFPGNKYIKTFTTTLKASERWHLEKSHGQDFFCEIFNVVLLHTKLFPETYQDKIMLINELLNN